ncbi:MAG TPA: GNAT family N-acetyltransferase [Solirubrobacteraceae bacterium]|jgi:acetyltransferase
MAATMNELVAREHARELLRAAAERRMRAGARTRPRRARRLKERQERVLLPDGRRVHVRRLRRADRDMYGEAVAALSERSRYLRFASPMPKLSESMLDHMTAVDDSDHVAYAALAPRQDEIVGVARFVTVPDAPLTGEVAVAVADTWQGLGLGSVLLATIIERAQRANLRRLVAVTLSENHAAIQLARAVGFTRARSDGIYRQYERPL